jgi:dTDP-4-amino-4,6-dideoxygalactose transaminase
VILPPAVPYLDLSRQFEELREEWFSAIRAAGASGSFILGPQCQAFEREFAAAVGAEHAIGLANGTDALELSLRALGIGPGDEVITTPYTFFATAEAVTRVGATPVFADIEAGSFNIDPAGAAARITPRTRAILPVHIFGHPADMTALAELAGRHGLALVEDCAQAFGARHAGRAVGSFGATGCFSFYPTKVLGCFGDGGMITTNDSALDARVRKLRNHGATAPFMHDVVGCNSRLDEVQAAILRLKLKRINRDVAGRRRVADAYDARLRGTTAVPPPRPENGEHVFNLYTIRIPDRDLARARLTERGIGSSLCYPLGLHLQEVYRHLGYRPGDLPVAEQASLEALSLPIYPELTEEQDERVCAALWR